MNISIAIADSNKEYVERLIEVLQQYDDLTIHVYTNWTKLEESMEQGRFDVVLFDPDIADKKLTFPNTKLSICLYSDEARNGAVYAEAAKVIKYQRVSSIYKEMIRQYAEKAGYSAEFDHSQNTSITAVYSPIGGSGKTTVALALASQLVNRGKRVLFINMEQLNSSLCVNPQYEDGLVALTQAAIDKHTNFELKIKGTIKQGFNNMFYVEGFERLADYDAITAEEIELVLNKILRCGICDALVIDMESNLNAIGRSIAKLADRIVVVDRTGELPDAKMELFAKQAFVNEHGSKMVRVCNFAENHQKHSKEPALPVVGFIHNYGNLPLKSVIHAIDMNNEIAIDRIVNIQ